jgi:hypothetical protein
VTTMTAKNSDGQIGLFPDVAPSVPEWVSGRSAVGFDAKLAARYKRQAMAAAARSHQALLDMLRPALRALALARSDRCVTADDAQAWLIEHNYSPASLGNGAGSLFRGSEWELAGFSKSTRVSRHSGRNGIWRLRR